MDVYFLSALPCVVCILYIFLFSSPRRRPVQRGRRVSHGATLESAEQPVQSQTQLHHLIDGSVSEPLPNGRSVMKLSSIPQNRRHAAFSFYRLYRPPLNFTHESHVYAPGVNPPLPLPDPSGFSKVLKTLSAESTRQELLAFLQQYGSHYVSEALYGSELSCSIYFPSKKAQQQLWLQYQKGERPFKPKIDFLFKVQHKREREEKQSRTKLGCV